MNCLRTGASDDPCSVVHTFVIKLRNETHVLWWGGRPIANLRALTGL
jgi:hypothetical protein